MKTEYDLTDPVQVVGDLRRDQARFLAQRAATELVSAKQLELADAKKPGIGGDPLVSRKTAENTVAARDEAIALAGTTATEFDVVVTNQLDAMQRSFEIQHIQTKERLANPVVYGTDANLTDLLILAEAGMQAVNDVRAVLQPA